MLINLDKIIIDTNEIACVYSCIGMRLMNLEDRYIVVLKDKNSREVIYLTEEAFKKLQDHIEGN